MTIKNSISYSQSIFYINYLTSSTLFHEFK